MPEKSCNCKDYQSMIQHIDDFILCATLRDGRKYTNPPFKFCPWCGGKSEQIQEQSGRDTGSDHSQLSKPCQAKGTD